MMVPRDLFGRVPAMVRLIKPVTPGVGLGFGVGDRVYVEAIEPDGMGIGVRTGADYISLHPSEFEVLAWADLPAEESAEEPAEVPTTKTRRSRRKKICQ